MPEETMNCAELTGDIVSAYVAANNIQRSELRVATRESTLRGSPATMVRKPLFSVAA
jgi:predicted transcriptional regulator